MVILMYNTFVATKKVNDIWKMGVVDINCRYEDVIDREFNIILQPIYSDVTIWDIDFYNSDGIYKEEYFDKNNKYHEDYFVVEKDGKIVCKIQLNYEVKFESYEEFLRIFHLAQD